MPLVSRGTPDSNVTPPPGNQGATRGGPDAPSPGDRPPRAPRRGTAARRTKAPQVTDTQIRDALTELLTAPGIAFGMVGHQWPAEHVLRTGPELADQLVKASHISPWWRDKLVRLAQGENVLGYLVVAQALTMAAGAYIIPLAAYFRAPVPQRIAEGFAGGPIPIPPLPDHGYTPPPESSAEGPQNGASIAESGPVSA